MTLYSHRVMDFYNEKKEYYNNFLKKTNQKKKVIEHIESKIRNKNIRKILLIGCGDGSTELKSIRKSKIENPEIYCVDPSKKMYEDFLDNLQKEGLQKNLKKFELKEFESKSFKPPKNDLSLLISSIYFIKGWRNPENKENPLKKLYGALNPGGKALITIKREDSPHRKVKSKAGGGNTCSKKVKESLEKINIPHHHYLQEAEIDVTDCFRKNHFSPNEKGKMLLRFMFRGKWEEFEEPKKKDIINELKKQSFRRNDKRILPKRYDYIWIEKN